MVKFTLSDAEGYILLLQSDSQTISVSMEETEGQSWSLLFEDLYDKGVPMDSLIEQARILFVDKVIARTNHIENLNVEGEKQ